MATAPRRIPTANTTGRTSDEVVLAESSNEFFLGVVGHAGSGTSLVAEQMKDLLGDAKVNGRQIEQVVILKASEAIAAWAREQSLPVPDRMGPRNLEDVKALQDLGDKMREGYPGDRPDHAAVARRLVRKIREIRAR